LLIGLTRRAREGGRLVLGRLGGEGMRDEEGGGRDEEGERKRRKVPGRAICLHQLQQGQWPWLDRYLEEMHVSLVQFYYRSGESINIPRVPPVTRAVWPSSEKSCCTVDMVWYFLMWWILDVVEKNKVEYAGNKRQRTRHMQVYLPSLSYTSRMPTNCLSSVADKL
jgi:hypothetical protein